MADASMCVSRQVELQAWEDAVRWGGVPAQGPSWLDRQPTGGTKRPVPGAALGAHAAGAGSAGPASDSTPPSQSSAKRPRQLGDAVLEDLAPTRPLLPRTRQAMPAAPAIGSNEALLRDAWVAEGDAEAEGDVPPPLPCVAIQRGPTLLSLQHQASMVPRLAAGMWAAHAYRAALKGGMPFVHATSAAAAGAAGAALATVASDVSIMSISHTKTAVELLPEFFPVHLPGPAVYRQPPISPLSRPSQHAGSGALQRVVLADGSPAPVVLQGLPKGAPSAQPAKGAAAKAEAAPPGAMPHSRMFVVAGGLAEKGMEAMSTKTAEFVRSRLAARGGSGGGAATRAATTPSATISTVRFDTVESLSARWGDLVLLEYVEELPLMLSRPGMSSRLVTHWLPTDSMRRALKRRQAAGHKPLLTPSDWQDGPEELSDDESGDEEVPGKHTPPDVEEGTLNTLASKEQYPLLGSIEQGKWTTTIVNNLMMAPIWQHDAACRGQDFLLIMAPAAEGEGEWVPVLRQLPPTFTVGQIEPRMEVPEMASAESSEFLKQWACLVFVRLASTVQNGYVPASTLRAVFGEELAHPCMMKHLIETVAMHDGRTGAWRLVPNGPDEDALRNSHLLQHPEEVCLWHAFRAGMWQLRRRGMRLNTAAVVNSLDKVWNHLRGLATAAQDSEVISQRATLSALMAGATTVRHILDVAPWSLSGNYVNVHSKGGTGELTLAGPGGNLLGDPSGRGEGFSFVKEAVYKQRTQKARSRIGGREGTKYDLRSLSQAELASKLLEEGYTEEEIASARRWDRVKMLKRAHNEREAQELSRKKLSAPIREYMYSTKETVSAEDKRRRRKEQECAIQAKQRAVLSSATPPPLDSDTDSSDDSDGSDDSLGDALLGGASRRRRGRDADEQHELHAWKAAEGQGQAGDTGSAAELLNPVQRALPPALRSPPLPAAKLKRGQHMWEAPGPLALCGAPPGAPFVNDVDEGDVACFLRIMLRAYAAGVHHRFRHMVARTISVTIDGSGNEVVRVHFDRRPKAVRTQWLEQVAGVDLTAPMVRKNFGRKAPYHRAVAEREKARLAACLRALVEAQVLEDGRLVSLARKFDLLVASPGVSRVRLGSDMVPVCSMCHLWGHDYKHCPVEDAKMSGLGALPFNLDEELARIQAGGSVSTPAPLPSASEPEDGDEELAGEGEEEGVVAEEEEEEEDVCEAVEEGLPVSLHSLLSTSGSGQPPRMANYTRPPAAELAHQLERLVLLAMSSDRQRLLRAVPQGTAGHAVYAEAVQEHLDLVIVRRKVLRGELTTLMALFEDLVTITDNMSEAARLDPSLKAHEEAAHAMYRAVEGQWDHFSSVCGPLEAQVAAGVEAGAGGGSTAVEAGGGGVAAEAVQQGGLTAGGGAGADTTLIATPADAPGDTPGVSGPAVGGDGGAESAVAAAEGGDGVDALLAGFDSEVEEEEEEAGFI